MRKQFDNQRTITGHDNDALYFRDDSSSVGSSRENIRLGPFIDFEVSNKKLFNVGKNIFIHTELQRKFCA